MAVSNHFTAISSKFPKYSFITNQQRIRFNLSSRNPVQNLFYNAKSFQKPSIQSLPYPNYNPMKNLVKANQKQMGEIKQLGYAEDGGGGFEMKISGNVILEDVKLGDSISVNGTCLTVTEFDKKESDFSVGLAPETLRKTSLIELGMGGHFVQGHVDGTGEIVSLEFEGDSLWVKVKTPPEVLKFIVPKGFIAVDGTSLTVCQVFDDEECFNFMLVAYTQQNVVIPLKKVGQKVNLEVDILGKYVERLLHSGFTSNITPK
ncbi:hypothetical protein MKW94_013926 [Papaver nudicaule]|uniref:Riboflavin synthase n=1 Tax=Papaver nudicaule TaxID=74823 RepID=A0AA41S3H7_PAPNU|nr:hypothetical protein [Papaver nudicaule]